jgi:NAD(P)-dependent dehydrogenase (short-subunit alcohol dehydrogenase family)
MVADATAERDARALVTRAEDLGPLEVLVCHAPIRAPEGAVWEVDADLWWTTLKVNVRAAFLLARAATPGLLERGRGTVLYLPTPAGPRPAPYRSAAAAAEAAVLSLTADLAAEAGARGVQAFALLSGAPGPGAAPPPAWPAMPLPDRVARAAVALASRRHPRLSGRAVYLHDPSLEVRAALGLGPVPPAPAPALGVPIPG